jgi:methionine-rich copper-binding protein CopC
VTRRHLGRGAAALVVALLLGLVTTVPAAAHNGLVGSDPANGSSVAQTPGAVVLTFDEPALALGTQVVVTGPDGPASTGAPELVNATVRQPLVPGAPAGSYTIDWRVTSVDGHPITGQIAFFTGAAGAGTYTGPAAPATAVDPGGAPVWGWVLLAALLLGAAGVLAVLRRRSRSPQD